MYLGIDLGTSEVKLLLLDANGQACGRASAPLTVQRPHPLWSEQDSASWWAATEQAVADLRRTAPEAWRRIRAIGLSGQMHGAVLLNAQDQVLRPAILWNDGRSFAECEALTLAAPALADIAGNLAMPGFTAPKLLWVRQHEPQIFDATATVLLPKDYLRLLLTGDKVTDPSDAAGTLWLDVAARDWSDTLLAACGLRREQMPRVVESNRPGGSLRPALAQAWGLSPDVVVAGSAGDNAASAIGIGATRPGQGFLSMGTSGVLFVVNDRYRPNPASAVHAFCHALPGRWHQMSVMLSAASALRWFCGFSGVADERALLEEVQALPVQALDAAPLFLPYLAGERTPHNDPFACGVFHGLGHDSTRAHGGYAVLEGVAFGMADGLAALQAAGTQVSELSFVGGGSRSAYWAQLMADVLGVDIVRHADADAGGALGAARLAWMADGGEEAHVCQRPDVSDRFQPRPERAAPLAARLARFRALYQLQRTLPPLPTSH
ncbi:xylulokinase [Roseateles depolymerans]|uniref:Xylulose kinase n=1 Tax=Roseateles depolymerans TaxID=76731 RepID=A0A0U3LG73_9BURK|nr:xylulokinase [Roseateles depolymerans]ALV07071.1 Xylulose kinase [Roseateles depolymerans]REG20054.1 xylulokinase [Roseateles depolymerans]